MNVELSVQLEKNGVFFAGETLCCELTFRGSYRAANATAAVFTGRDSVASTGGVSLPSTATHERTASLTDSVSRAPTRRSSLASQSSSVALQQGRMNGNYDGDSMTTPATSVANSPPPSLTDPTSPRHSIDESSLWSTASKQNGGVALQYPSASDSGVSPQMQARAIRANRVRSVAASLAVKPITLLWGFAQVVGSFAVDETLLRTDAFAGLNTRNMYQAAGVGGVVGGFGGGTLGITAAMISGQSPEAQAASTAGKMTLPLFTTPPSIIFCDLTLNPGQEKTYQFQIKLPTTLPPSHRGKAIRFQYRLIVGTQHGGPNRPSHIVQIPFRVFNRVNRDGTRYTHDLLRPAAIHDDRAVICDKDQVFALQQPSTRPAPAPAQSSGGRMRFLRSVFDAAKREHDMRDRRERAPSDVFADDTADGSSARHAMYCYQAARAATFSLSLNEQRVAALRLAKTTLRLGDTLRGMLDFNGAALACYHVSISLETMETAVAGHARGHADQVKRLTRRRHAEWHAHCHQMSRLGFTLAVPHELAPEFETTAVHHVWQLHVELIVGKTAAPLEQVAKQDGSVIHEARTMLAADTLNCTVPLRVYPCVPSAAHGYRTQQTFVVV